MWWRSETNHCYISKCTLFCMHIEKDSVLSNIRFVIYHNCRNVSVYMDLNEFLKLHTDGCQIAQLRRFKHGDCFKSLEVTLFFFIIQHRKLVIL